MKRTLVIGLDGASPHLVADWLDKLPNLRSLISAGTSGTLWSVLPPRSIPAWYCFATGMNPAKIGVFGFSQRRAGTYDYTFANLTYCRAPAFWQLLNRHGLKTVIAHVPGTYPAHPVAGAMLSGWPGPLNRGSLTYTHPPGLSREIDAHLGQPFEFLSPRPMRLDNDAEMLSERIRLVKMHAQAAHQVLKQPGWQAGVVVFSPLDRASHQFWRHLDPSHPLHDPGQAGQFGDALLRVYQACDEEVGRLLSLLDENDSVMIVSDHGFGPEMRSFYLNEWLLQKGYLVMQAEWHRQPAESDRLVGRLAAPLFHLDRASPVFRRLAAPFKRRRFSNYLRKNYLQVKTEGLLRLNHLPVDWGRTRAYCPDEGSLYLNLRGRDPQGAVAPGAEAQALLQEIMEELQNIPDPDTGQPVPVSLHPKESIYSGPFLSEAPELLVSMDNYATSVMAELGGQRLFDARGPRSGTHTLEGLFIARGPGIAPGKNLDAGLMDIAPTVLHLLGLPVPEQMDGRVLLDMYASDAEPRQRPVETTPLDLEQYSLDGGLAYSPQEAEQVEERLRDLGYLG